MLIIDADAHVLENEHTWDFLTASEQRYRPTLVKSVHGQRRVYWLIEGKVQGFNVLPSDEADLQARTAKMGRMVYTPPETREYIKRKINSAQWLIEAIEQRRNTLVRTAQAIVDHLTAEVIRRTQTSGVPFRPGARELLLGLRAQRLGIHQILLDGAAARRQIRAKRPLREIADDRGENREVDELRDRGTPAGIRSGFFIRQKRRRRQKNKRQGRQESGSRRHRVNHRR